MSTVRIHTLFHIPCHEKRNDKQHRHQHHHTDHLDDNRRITHRSPHGIPGADDVRHLMDCRSGEDSHLVCRQLEHSCPIKDRIEEHRQRTENNHRRHSHSRLIRLRTNSSVHAQNRCRTADSTPAGCQQGNTPVHPQQLPQHDAQQNRPGDNHRIDDDSRKTYCRHILECKPESIKNDSETQHTLSTESYTRHPGLRKIVAETVRIEHTQYDSHNHRAQRESLHPIHVADVESCTGEQSNQQYTMQHTAPLFCQFHVILAI